MAGFIFHPQCHLEMNISSCFIPNTEQKYLLNISAFLHQSPSGKSREEAALSAKLERSRREPRAVHAPHTHRSAGWPWDTPHLSARGSPHAFAGTKQSGPLLRPCCGQGAGVDPRLPVPRASQQPGTSANSPFNPGPKTPLPCKWLSEGGQRAGNGEQP